jgi:predicted ATPase/transcriptional regulator with XRE-family HTH domain
MRLIKRTNSRWQGDHHGRKQISDRQKKKKDSKIGLSLSGIQNSITFTVHTSFGNWVKRRRKALDLTQQELAQRVGCSTATIFKIEADERRPSRQIAELLALHLEISPDQKQLFIKVARQERAIDSLGSVSGSDPVQLVSTMKPHNIRLPVAPTSIVGRENELRMIIQKMQDPACRLLTLVGPGGVGKTRLAMEAAHSLQDTFSHAAYFISLVGTSAAEHIVPAIASVLGFSFSGKTEPGIQLFNYLKERELLLVLDNLEHLLNGIEILAELLEYARGVKLLVTSREVLRLRSEWVFEVQGLPIPTGIPSESLESNSAIALFLQRAKQAKFDFTATASDLMQVKRICQLVEGLPLGLELAAAWVRTLSVSDVAGEIEKSIDFLSSTARDLPPRHRSIRAVFDNSWSLLSQEERQVMQRLSVFQGGFTREASEKVAGATLSLLSSLVERSLVRSSGAMRYDLHELIRQYAEIHLRQEAGQERTVRILHAEYYLGLLAESEFKLRSEHQTATMGQLKPEIDNIRLAWISGIEYQKIDPLRQAAGALYYFYELQQLFREVELLFRHAAEELERLLADSGGRISAREKARLEGALAVMQTRQAFFVQRMGRLRDASDLLRISLERLQSLDEPFTTAYTFVFLGIISMALGDLEEAHQFLTKSVPLTGPLEHPWLKTIALCFLGEAEYARGRYQQAYSWFSQSIELNETIKDPYTALLIGTLFSRTAYALGRLEEAEGLLRESLSIAQESGNRWALGLGLEQMALIALSQQNTEEARHLLGESVALHLDVGDMWSLSRSLDALSQIEISCQELKEAERHARDALQSAVQGEFYSNALDAVATLAVVYSLQEKHKASLELSLFTLGHPSSTQMAKERAQELAAKLETQLDAQQVEDARSRMESLSLKTLLQDRALLPSNGQLLRLLSSPVDE